MKVINVTQGYGKDSSSHKLSYALDLSGKDSGRDNVYAPFDAIITKLYQPKDTKLHATTVWLTSTNKVLSPNGYYGYLTVSITHPDEILKMKVGTKYKQGEFICREGKTGRATGNHIHLEVSKGKVAGWSKKSDGNYTEYVILNPVRAEEYLFLRNDAIVKNNTYKNNKYRFIKEKDIEYKVNNKNGLNMRKGPSTKEKIITSLKDKDVVLKFYNEDNWGYVYHYEKMGFVSNNYLSKL